MKRLFVAYLLLVSIAPLNSQRAPGGMVLFSRVLTDGTVSLLVDVQASPAPGVTEVRVELPRDAAANAVLLQGPAGWRAARDGNWLRLVGDQASPPFRMRVTLFDLKDQKQLQRARVRIRLGDRDLSDQTLAVTSLAALQTAGSTAGLVHIPSVIAPGETIDVKILDLKRTPADGQWFVAGYRRCLWDRIAFRSSCPTTCFPETVCERRTSTCGASGFSMYSRSPMSW